MPRFLDVVSVILAVDKHRIAGIAAIVVGVVIIALGALRAVRRLTGAALVLLAGAVVVGLGVLVSTHTIHG
jgi:hypothetical protein